MNITVYYWPVLRTENRLGGGTVFHRTKSHLREIPCVATLAERGLVKVKFPELQGVWEFRLSTGSGSTEKMQNYVIEQEHLNALRVAKKEIGK